MGKLEKTLEELIDARVEKKMKELTLGYEYSSTCPGEDDMDVILYLGATPISTITLN
jgi:hypothetical protein